MDGRYHQHQVNCCSALLEKRHERAIDALYPFRKTTLISSFLQITTYEKHTTAGRKTTYQDSNLSEMIQVFASLRNKISAMLRKTSF